MPLIDGIRFTDKELSIMEALVSDGGPGNKQVAWITGMSEALVKASICRIGRKLRPATGMGRLGVGLWYLRRTMTNSGKAARSS